MTPQMFTGIVVAVLFIVVLIVLPISEGRKLR
jgi:hypothetical protein